MSLPALTSNALLPAGVHPGTEDDLRERLVIPFAPSRRDVLVEGLMKYQQELTALGVHATQWVDGSFVDGSRKDPDDIDVVNFCSADVLETIPDPVMEQVGDLLDGQGRIRERLGCHPNLVVVYPESHPKHAWSEHWRRYWLRYYAQARDYTKVNKPVAPERGSKGLVQLHVGDPNLCPALSHVD